MLQSAIQHPKSAIPLLVLGDLMLDRYTWGDAERVSPEAPVLVLEAEYDEVRLGGAASVAALAASLGAAPHVAGVVGDDPEGRIVRCLLADLQRSRKRESETVGWGQHALGGRRPTIAQPAAENTARKSGVRSRERGARSQNAEATPARSASKASEMMPPACLACPVESHAGFYETRSASKAQHENEANGFSDCPLFPVTCNLLLLDSTRPTTLKQRFLGRAAHHHPHQILRVDRESRQPLDAHLAAKLAVSAIAVLPACRAVLISDYAKGVCTVRLLADVIAAARARRTPVLVDPGRGVDYERYRGASLIKPNRDEAAAAVGRPIGSPNEAFAVGRELCRRFGIAAAVITLDADGLVLVEAGGRARHFAAQARQVCDVTGAGDTCLAMLGLSLARHDDLAIACRQAVMAAGLQVERLGVAPITWDDLASAELGTPAGRDFARSSTRSAERSGIRQNSDEASAERAEVTGDRLQGTAGRGHATSTPTRGASKAAPANRSGIRQNSDAASAERAEVKGDRLQGTVGRGHPTSIPTRGASKAAPANRSGIRQNSDEAPSEAMELMPPACPVESHAGFYKTRGASKEADERCHGVCRNSGVAPTNGACSGIRKNSDEASGGRQPPVGPATEKESEVSSQESEDAWQAPPTDRALDGALDLRSALPVPHSALPVPRSALPAPRSALPKLTSLDALVPLVSHYIAGGRRVVFANGCFDLLHAGHARLLAEAKAAGDVLIVAINSDAGVARLKGRGRPVIGELDRAALVAALAAVDHVLIFDDDTPERLIYSLRPDVLVKGAEHAGREVIGRRFVESYGGQVVLVEHVPGRSTTRTIAQIRAETMKAEG